MSPKVLIVEDNLDTRDLFKMFFSIHPGLGLVVHFAESATDAELHIEAAEMIDEPYDLIVLDIAMAGRTGVDLAESIRKKDPTVKIAFWTAWPGDWSKDHAKGIGAIGYWPKPVMPDDLAARIVAALEA